MTKRYFTMRFKRVRSEDEDKVSLYEANLTIYEPDPEPYETGILDAQGQPLWATNEIDQIGFIRKK